MAGHTEEVRISFLKQFSSGNSLIEVIQTMSFPTSNESNPKVFEGAGAIQKGHAHQNPSLYLKAPP